MSSNRILTGAAAVVAAAALIGTGAALSGAASPAPTPNRPSGADVGGAPTGAANPHDHTPVTGGELSKVTAAVKGKDSTVTLTSVRRDPDGSYDAFGTKAGANVMLEVSKDLTTITAHPEGLGAEPRSDGPRSDGPRSDGPRSDGPRAGRGGHDTPVAGAELSKVTAAVKADDSAVTLTSVRRDPDGSYDAFGTKAGASVRLEVSKDLTTTTTQMGGHRG